MIDHEHFGRQLGTRLLPHLGFGLKVKKKKNFHFALFLGKTSDNIFKNCIKCKIPYFWALFAKILEKINFPQKSGSIPS